ncbi:MAG: DUF2189 domain-containing protein [Pseudomonadota bacterium]
MTASLPFGAPSFARPALSDLTLALGRGWRDFMAAPLPGLIVGLACVLAGWGITGLTLWAGHTFWLILAVFGFPLVAPFGAVGLYEVSRMRGLGRRVRLGDVLDTMWMQRGRQMPHLSAMIIILLLFWFFLGHMICALFLGLAPMTNITTSLDVFVSADGLQMLAFGSVVGGAFGLLLYAVCVMGLPMLMDREVDYVTAMIRSFGVVREAPVVMLGWAALIGILLFAAMLPGFLGLMVVMPWLGHASWHLYDRLAERGAA